MSKTIDTLKKASFKEDVLRNHIADTYFYQKNRPKPKPLPQARKKNKIPGIKYFAKTVTTVSAVAAALALAVVISVMAYSYLDKQNVQRIRNKVAGMNTIDIAIGGAPNREIIKRFEFRGYAKNRQSRILKEEISLVSTDKYKWADMSIGFKFPVDFSSKTLRMSIRGEVGGEKVSLVLRDASNRSARISDIYTSSKWSPKVLRLATIGGDIDLSRINHMRIESVYVGESSREDDPKIPFRIYVKDISISAEKEI